MTNILGSLVESYMYADMYNREYEGGADTVEKVHVGGVPVDYILPEINDDNRKSANDNNNEQDGGMKNTHGGPFKNKVVPVGLVLIQPCKDRDVEYEDDIYNRYNREVVPDSLYDLLFGSVLIANKNTQARNTPKSKSRANRNTTRKRKY